MTYRQYKLIKQLTKALSLFAGVVFFGYIVTTFALLSIQAEGNCDQGNVSISSSEDASSVPVNDEFNFTIIDNDSSVTAFSYIITVKDMDTQKESNKGSGTFTGSKQLSVVFNTKGEKQLYVKFIKSNNSACDYESTLPISLTVTDNTANSVNIDISGPSTGIKDTNNNLVYNIKVTGESGSNIILTIDDIFKWGSDSGNSGQHIGSDGKFEGVFDWNITGTGTGPHTLTVKVFSPNVMSNGKYAMTDFKDMNIYICPKGTSTDKCETDFGSDSTGSPVELADSTTVDIGGSILKFNLTRGSGIGGLINLAINLLLLLVGAFAFIGIMIAGIQYITAGGDSSKSDKAKKTIIYSVIAIVLVIFSAMIINAINKLFK